MSKATSMTAQASFSVKAETLLKKYATHLTASLSLVIGVTGTMMFFHFFKAKVQDMHAWLGMAFLLAVVLHALRNRRSLASLFSQPLMRILLGIIGLVAASFLFLAPPKKINPGNSAAQALLRAPIDKAAPILGISTAEAIARLDTAGGVDATPAKSIAAIARLNHRDPIELLVAVMGGAQTE
jgi:hypothetical protein